MDPNLLASILAGKITKKLVRLNKSGGTAAPGLFSLYLDKNALSKLSEPLTRTILVSGTNGKTTTTRLIGNFFQKNSIKFIHNRHGSNLERGLLTTLIENSTFTGELSASTALFEVDEAAFAQVLPKLKPTTIVLTNLFRDQLDRYGEVDNIKRLWLKALEGLSPNTTLVLNADDPSLAYLGETFPGKTVYFGINDPSAKLEETPRALDSSKCPKCNSELHYNHYYISHQGDYTCKNCGFTRPKLDVEAKDIKISEDQAEVLLKDQDFSLELKTSLSGIFNIYNILGAYSSLKTHEFDLGMFPLVLKEFSAVFGRGEKVQIEDKQILVALAKNPTGFNEIIRTFLKKDKQTVLIVINDKIADGRDVSWLWDVDFENLRGKENQLVVSGFRAADMGLRLKYAGINDFEVVESLNEALKIALEKTESGQTLTIIPTYTAMLSLKNILAKKKVSSDFWED